MSSIDFQGLVLGGVTSLDRGELGRGAFGRVYAVSYCETICAAKEIHSILVEGVTQIEMQRTVESFMRECHQSSVLRHPNVIQFLGVYYPSGGAGGNSMRLPVMVMEMMVDSLTSLVKKHEKIPIHIKCSIVQDVSLGLCYLHSHNPPIIHRDLSPNNILLTAHHVAKISDLGVAKVIKADSRKTMTKAPGTIAFMPPECLSARPVYGPPMDVFSFAGIILHTFNQQWPEPSAQVEFDPRTRKMMALTEVERRQQYIDKMTGEVEWLRPLVEECLDNDPAMRPTIASVCERIQAGNLKGHVQDVITLYQENEQLRDENEQQRRNIQEKEIQLNFEAECLKQQLSSIGISRQQVTNQLSKASSGEYRSTNTTSKLKTEAPPLIPALSCGRYCIKWTQLANLSAPMYEAYATVKETKIYVAGGYSPYTDSDHQVHVYDINTDFWSQLPVSGHYYGVPHIIGGKLAIIGGCLTATKEMTNKVSTYDENTQTWMSYYPDLHSVRYRPGVTSHLEHVIVAGGLKGNDMPEPLGDIEVLNWIENSQWFKVSTQLPARMFGFTPIIADDQMIIVRYLTTDMDVINSAYKIAVSKITGSQCSSIASNSNWIRMNAPSHWSAVLLPGSSPPVIAGGHIQGVPTEDIRMYDSSSQSWRKAASLSFARCVVALAAVGNNAIVVIGACAKDVSSSNSDLSSLVTVELGQVKLLSKT